MTCWCATMVENSGLMPPCLLVDAVLQGYGAFAKVCPFCACWHVLPFVCWNKLRWFHIWRQFGRLIRGVEIEIWATGESSTWWSWIAGVGVLALALAFWRWRFGYGSHDLVAACLRWMFAVDAETKR